MKALTIITITIASATMLLAGEGGYYAQLQSMLSNGHLMFYPKDPDKDVNLVTIEKGASGLHFGASMDDLVELWGNPSIVRNSGDAWFLAIGGCRFGFIDNELLYISIRSTTIPDAHFGNGISFSSSYEDIVSAFENLTESRNNTLELCTKNGYKMKLYFFPDTSNGNKLKLFMIELKHPEMR